MLIIYIAVSKIAFGLDEYSLRFYDEIDNLFLLITVSLHTPQLILSVEIILDLYI